MTKRRSRGDGGLHWDEPRQRWIASVTVGYTPAGKRIVKKASGKTKTAAKDKLKQIIRDYEDGLLVSSTGYTVADAVRSWLDFGLSGRDAATVEKCKILANKRRRDHRRGSAAAPVAVPRAARKQRQPLSSSTSLVPRTRG
ncbi:hypothetical protein [Nonomuraea wenchangensis]|uniref:hypothetical protein n=1 Tax=Nonomuraea wenchangensis TaxID=568860 RepID=UPI0033184192